MSAFISRLVRRHPGMHKLARTARTITQRGVWSALDVGETLLGRRDPLTPPRRLINVGSNSFTRSDFHAIGRELFRYLVHIGGVKPDDRVLDVGCGVGRMAIPLTRYLSPTATYDGFDIIAESVEQCRRVFSPRFNNFHFHHADLFNTKYNPGGKYHDHEYKFPFPDRTFSFVLLTSVFTHMQSDGVENYLRETARVLAPGGRCFITYFILNPESEAAIAAQRSAMEFVFPIAHGKTTRIENPDEAVAFEEAYLRELYRKSGLSIVEPINHGSWCGRQSGVGFQDIIVGVKNKGS